MHRLEVIEGPGSRKLGAAQWGDPDGTPVFNLHGTPGSRLGRHPDENAVRAAGLRVITYDRPGYGASDRHAGRRIVNCAADVSAIADALGIDRFFVSGGSGGGPHSLAVAARLGDRVLAAECVVSAAPYDAAGLEFLAGMDPENQREFGWALQGEETLHRELTRESAEALARLADDPSKVLSDDWELDTSDRALLARTDLHIVFQDMMREAFRNGVWGWVDDDLALVTPWGFDLTEIRVPVTVRYGEKDVLVPAAHGAWLAANIPNPRVVISSDSGHLTSPEDRLKQLVELTTC
jgi:pimeloyl-ACP methyl ester carboxylesterase